MQSTDKTSQRSWLSPLTGLTFLAIGVTGILMFFHVRLPGTTQLHELGGLLFVVVGVWHLKLNWRAIVRYCSGRAGKLALVVGTLVLATFLGLGIGHGQQRPSRGVCTPTATSPAPVAALP
jgi:hypothetical protein